LVVFALLVACQSGASLGTPCTSSSSCVSPLVCRLGRCRNECAVNRDCPIGAQCFLDATGLGACELTSDHVCGSGQCDPGLSCLASSCVRSCTQRTDCPSDGTCTIASGASIGVCSDLRTVDAGTSDASAVDASGNVDAGVCTPLHASHVCLGEGFACAVLSDTTVSCWGRADNGFTGRAEPATMCDVAGGPIPCAHAPVGVLLEDQTTALTGAIDVVCGAAHACALMSNGQVRCWGRNFAGMLGAPNDGVVGARTAVDSSGVAIPGVTAIGTGEDHTCALTAMGPMCWGANDYAQDGTNTMTQGEGPSVATQLMSAGAIGALAVMYTGTCIVDSSSTVRCLGENAHAQLGVPTSTVAQSGSLLPIGGLTVSATHPVVSGGQGFVCALDASAHVQCWGWDYSGSLGRNATTESTEPTPAPLYGTASTITFASLFVGPNRLSNCAVTPGHDLWCWGANDEGQLARDPASPDQNAALVVNIPPISEGACSDSDCCAITMGGEVWCWGDNTLAQLGRGTATPFEWHPQPVCAQ
jgi:alpha-tubulin suppressor-like RCC1 family protein